jgi:hypothetical protein
MNQEEKNMVIVYVHASFPVSPAHVYSQSSRMFTPCESSFMIPVPYF